MVNGERLEIHHSEMAMVDRSNLAIGIVFP